MVLGAILLAYAGAVLLWRDPVTDLWARYQQHRLNGQLAQLTDVYRGLEPVEHGLVAQAAAASAAASRAVVVTTHEQQLNAARRAVASAATRLQAETQQGQALGRIVVPRLGINPVFVHGTRWAQDLSKGPGHYEETPLPGLGKLVAIAGHRTTFGAPFRHIDSLKPGDRIVLEMPYGRFAYAVFGHRIVPNDDWSIIRERGFETLVLSACHPLYSAKQRFVVFAKLVEVRAGNVRFAPRPASSRS